MVICGFVGLKKVQNTNSYTIIHCSSILQIKPVQNTTNTTEITENSFNLVPHTLKLKLVRISHPLSTTQNRTFFTFLTIVLALNAFLTCTGQRSEQIITPIHLVWKRMHRVLKTCITFLS